MRKVISFILIGVLQLSSLYASADMPRLQIHLAQNLFVPGENLWYSAVFVSTPEFLSTSPIVHVTLSSADKFEQDRQVYQLSKGVISGHMTLPYDIGQGTYVLSAEIYDQTGHTVVLSASRIIHVLGESTSEYYQFVDRQKEGFYTVTTMPSGDFKAEKAYKTRDQICQSISEPQLVIVSSESLHDEDRTLIYDSGRTDLQTEYLASFSIENDGVRPFLYSPQDRKIITSSFQDNVGYYIASIPIDNVNRKIQMVDAYSLATIDKVTIVHPTPIWMLANLRKYEMQVAKPIIDQSANRGLISRVYGQVFERDQLDSPNNLEEVNSDDLFRLSDYQVFESLELFIKEAVSPIKLTRQKNKVDLQIVDKENRRFFTGNPLLIVDDRIVSSVEDVLAIPFVEIEQLSLVRSSVLLDRDFGIFGKNGVLKIKTKRALTNDDFIAIPALSSSESQVRSNPNVSLSDRTPRFSNLQYMAVTNTDACFNHNDEIGEFIIQQVNISTGVKNLSIYTVDLGIQNFAEQIKD